MRSLQDHYRLMVEHASDVVFTVDLVGCFDWVSPSVRRLSGAGPEVMYGEPVVDYLHPDDRAVGRRGIEEVLDGREVTFIGRILTVDDGWRWVSVRIAPMMLDEGLVVGAVGTLADVHELVTARQHAIEAEARMRGTFDSMFDPFVLFTPVRDESGAVVDFAYAEANDAAVQYYGEGRDRLIGVRLRRDRRDERSQQLADMLTTILHTGVPLVLDDYEFDDGRHGETVRWDVRATGAGDGISLTWRDVTQRHAVEERLAHLATHDPLTGLANRSALVDELDRALNSARRAGRVVAALMLDLDHFKSVNDSHGHPIGDQLLRVAAKRVQQAVRGGDLVARLGGDEFVIVMRDLEDSTEALRIGLRVVDSFRDPLTAGGHELLTTTSVGIAISTPATSTDDLLHEADTALYRAKRDGRDRCSLFNDDLRAAATERITLEAQLRPALDLGELAVYYQPAVDLHTGQVCAVEALLRWHHPSGELYSAERFIDLAEEIGVLVDSGNWVVREACREAARWQGRQPERPLVLRLNLGRQQLSEAGLMSAIREAVTDSDIVPSSICIEFPEDVLTLQSPTVRANLHELRGMGVRLVLDNFGMGHAALGQMRDRPVDMIKIDRTFVREMHRSSYAQRLVAGIVALAHELGVEATAEGVETEDQARFLRDLGCTSAQGFLFSAAVPPEQIEALLDRDFKV